MSKATFSGALTEVWPETMAPTLVAKRDVDSHERVGVA